MLKIVASVWNTPLALGIAERAGSAAVEGGAQVLLDAALQRVPYRTGNLASTGAVVSDGLEAAVGFGTDYGPVLRANPDWNYSGRSGRWLDEAVEGAGSDVHREMEAAARSAWPGG